MPEAGWSVDGLDGLAQGFDVELLEGDGVGVGEVLAVVPVGLLVVGGGLVEERCGDEDEELLGADAAVGVVLQLFGGEIFGYFLQLLFGQVAVGVEVAEQVGVVDPRGDGGFEEGYVFLFLVGVVAEVGVAGLDEDDGPQAYLAQDGGQVDAGVDAVGLARVPHLVEEAYVLHVGGGRGVGGAGDGGVGEAAQQCVVPDGQHLLLYVGLGAGLVALEACDDAPERASERICGIWGCSSLT